MAKVPIRIDINRDGFRRVRTCAEAFLITRGDLEGPILVRLGQTHRKQEKRIFASEGAEGQSGKWAALSPAYAAFKKRAVGARRKILVFTGDMKDRFITKGRPEHVSRLIVQGPTKAATGAVYQFGAESEIAGYHFQGSHSVRRSRPGTGKNKKKGQRKKPFRPVTFTVNLPKRDMVTKSIEQIDGMRQALVNWFRDERVPQVLEFCAKHLKPASRPGGP